MHVAIADPVIVEALLDAGADPLVSVRHYGTPLFRAAYEGQVASAEAMVGRGAKLDFHTACLLGHLDEVKKQLAADRNLLNQPLAMNIAYGESPLALAARGGQVDVARYLLDQGAKVESPTSRSPSPIHVAVMHGRKAVVELFLTRGVFPDVASAAVRCLRTQLTARNWKS